MQNKAWPITIFTCIAGGFVMFLRWLQINNSIEAATGLFDGKSALSVAVLTVYVVAGAGALGLALRLRRHIKPEIPASMPASQNLALPILSGVGTLCVAIGAILMLINGELWRKTAAILLLASAAGVAKITISKNLTASRGSLAALSSFPALTMTILLVVEYRLISKEPQLWLFAPRLLAIAGAAVGFYFLAGFPFGRAKPVSAAFFMSYACFLCMAPLAESSLPPGQLLLLLGCAMILWAQSWAVVDSCFTASSR